MQIVLATSLLFLLMLSAFFSGAETILFFLSPSQRLRINSKKPKSAKYLDKCLEDSALSLSTLLVGNTLVNFAIATIGYLLFDSLFPVWGAVLAIPAMTVVLLIFGEITPKQIALRNAERLAPGCARLLVFWLAILKPLNLAFRFTTRAFAPALKRERRALSDAELVSVLENAAENGDFAQADTEMIEGVLRLSEVHANDEMTPRVDMEGYDIDLEKNIEDRHRQTPRHRYLPVFRRSPDAIEGILDSQTGLIEDALFIPEQMTLDDLLEIFRHSKKPLAIVLDEYGGTAGLITLNDIMELIMGPAIFGSNNDEPSILKTARNTWIIDARASIDEINRELGLELEAEDADRLSGWVAFHAERIPHVGQQIEADGCRATILKRRKRRVVSVKLEVLSYPETDTDEELLAETDEAVEKTAEDDK
ncbi:MAG: HlyC/CorC family transporter [Kiritimatiellae bacterium]|nr:HlyC/CorC family transporter [Kiritimatiellia bacterium]